MRLLRHNVFLYVVLLLAACHFHPQVSKKALVSYLHDPAHGVSQQQLVNGIRVMVTAEPGDLLVAQELAGMTDKSPEAIRKLEDKYNKNYYFILKYSVGKQEVIRHLGSYQRYSDMLQVFAFQMRDYVNLITPAKDSIQLADFFYDQEYGMGDGNSIMLAFSKNKLNETKADHFDIRVAECGLDIGDLQFSFRNKDIADIPRLDYSSL